MPTYKQDLPVLLSKNEIETKVSELAKKINEDYAFLNQSLPDGSTQELIAVCTLKGSVVFYNDLLKKLHLPVRCEFLGTSSYGNQTTTTGEVKVTLDLNLPLTGKHVLIVEDIVDSGLTLNFVLDYLKARKPATLKTVSLLFKPSALQVKDLHLDYVGFEIPNYFVVGYGMDYAEKFRALPYIGKIESQH